MIYFKFKIGDFVCIFYVYKFFDCDYDVYWIGVYFIVNFCLIKQIIFIYELQDINGEDVEGIFNEGELQKVIIIDGIINVFMMV